MALPSDLITPKEAARLVRCSVNSIYRWISEGKVKSYKRATSRYLLSRADMEAMVGEVEVAKKVG